MTDEQRIQLKELRGMNDPQFSMSDANARDIESLRSLMRSLQSSIENLTTTFKYQVGNIVAKVEYLEKIFSESNESHRAAHKGLSDMTTSLSKKIPDVESMLKKHRKETEQIIEEVRGDVKLSYSKMGGGTMPRLMQAETPGGTINGSNTVFTLKNVPLFLEQDGQHISAANGGFTQAGYAGSITITCSVAPTQSLNSYWQ